jgi:hypothetical protein
VKFLDRTKNAKILPLFNSKFPFSKFPKCFNAKEKFSFLKKSSKKLQDKSFESHKSVKFQQFSVSRFKTPNCRFLGMWPIKWAGIKRVPMGKAKRIKNSLKN